VGPVILPRLPRLEALFGAQLDAVAETHVAALIVGAVSEDADLDFKESSYGGGDKGST
jgi:hypothetical protein